MKKSEPPKEAGRDIERRRLDTQVDVLAKQAGALTKAKPPKWREFNRFVDDVDQLVEFKDELNSMASGDIEDNAEWCQKLVAKCKAGLERFNRRENLDDPDDNESELSQAYIAKRVTVMVASFPNANPSSPEGYMQMLVEHVSAIEDLTEPALESACREIVETQKFAPAISEVLEAIRKHQEKWWDRYYAIKCAERDRCEALTRALAREQKEEKQAREREIEKATYAAQSAMRATQRLAQEIEDAKTKWTKIIERNGEVVERRREMLESEKLIHAQVQNEAKEAIAKLIERHAEAEKRESEAKCKLQALLAQEDEPKDGA